MYGLDNHMAEFIIIDHSPHLAWGKWLPESSLYLFRRIGSSHTFRNDDPFHDLPILLLLISINAHIKPLSRTDSESFRLIHQLTIDYDVEHID